MAPVSLPFTEVYEALERGTLDCALVVMRQAESGGLIPLAKHWTFDTTESAFKGYIPIAFSLQRWEGLPLAAQQLLHDRLDVWIENYARGLWEGSQAALVELAGIGGGINEYDAAARQALHAFNAAALDQLRTGTTSGDDGELVDRFGTNYASWTGIVGDLGYTEVTAADFAGWYAEDAIDMAPFMARLRADVLDPHRPGPAPE
ncbi:hypothetical protein BJF78_14460 [Pseudonocardia sp. CNS-139]|nr:hypothetical protein BJF78_14460 [Pseudonocardia sp. CNS-139]